MSFNIATNNQVIVNLKLGSLHDFYLKCTSKRFRIKQTIKLYHILKVLYKKKITT